MTRYAQIIRNSSAGSFALTPTGAWTIDETGDDILTSLSALYSAAAAANILDTAYLDDFGGPHSGQFQNVATQHVVDAYTLPKHPSFGTLTTYSDYVQDGANYIHIFSAVAPSATHVRLGLVFVVTTSTNQPGTPTEIGPTEYPPVGGSLWILIPAGAQDIPALSSGSVVPDSDSPWSNLAEVEVSVGDSDTDSRWSNLAQVEASTEQVDADSDWSNLAGTPRLPDVVADVDSHWSQLAELIVGAIAGPDTDSDWSNLAGTALLTADTDSPWSSLVGTALLTTDTDTDSLWSNLEELIYVEPVDDESSGWSNLASTPPVAAADAPDTDSPWSLLAVAFDGDDVDSEWSNIAGTPLQLVFVDPDVDRDSPWSNLFEHAPDSDSLWSNLAALIDLDTDSPWSNLAGAVFNQPEMVIPRLPVPAPPEGVGAVFHLGYAIPLPTAFITRRFVPAWNTITDFVSTPGNEIELLIRNPYIDDPSIATTQLSDNVGTLEFNTIMSFTVTNTNELTIAAPDTLIRPASLFGTLTIPDFTEPITVRLVALDNVQGGTVDVFIEGQTSDQFRFRGATSAARTGNTDIGLNVEGGVNKIAHGVIVNAKFSGVDVLLDHNPDGEDAYWYNQEADELYLGPQLPAVASQPIRYVNARDSARGQAPPQVPHISATVFDDGDLIWQRQLNAARTTAYEQEIGAGVRMHGILRSARSNFKLFTGILQEASERHDEGLSWVNIVGNGMGSLLTASEVLSTDLHSPLERFTVGDAILETHQTYLANQSFTGVPIEPWLDEASFIPANFGMRMNWWWTNFESPWNVLFRLVATQGPPASWYENRFGRLVFLNDPGVDTTDSRFIILAGPVGVGTPTMNVVPSVGEVATIDYITDVINDAHVPVILRGWILPNDDLLVSERAEELKRRFRTVETPPDANLAPRALIWENIAEQINYALANDPGFTLPDDERWSGAQTLQPGQIHRYRISGDAALDNIQIFDSQTGGSPRLPVTINRFGASTFEIEVENNTGSSEHLPLIHVLASQLKNIESLEYWAQPLTDADEIAARNASIQRYRYRLAQYQGYPDISPIDAQRMADWMARYYRNPTRVYSTTLDLNDRLDLLEHMHPLTPCHINLEPGTNLFVLIRSADITIEDGLVFAQLTLEEFALPAGGIPRWGTPAS